MSIKSNIVLGVYQHNCITGIGFTEKKDEENEEE